MSCWLQDKKSPEIEDYLKTNDSILLPIGSTEQHGSHLPLMTDTIQAVDITEEVANKMNLLVAPPVWYGWTPHHMGFKGTITMRAETLIGIVQDICYSLIFHGFKKIYIVNGHRVANVPPLEIAMVKIRNRTGAYIALIDVALIAQNEVVKICNTKPGSMGHAGVAETSYMLYKHSKLVDLSKAQVVMTDPSKERYLKSAFSSDPRLTGNKVIFKATFEESKNSSKKTGIKGNPLAASKDKGEKIFKAIVDNSIEFISETKSISVNIKEKPLPV